MTDDRDLDARLRADARAWRDEVDAARPDFDVATPAGTSRRRGQYIAGSIAAALVVGLAVLVVTLRPGDKTAAPRIQAGGAGDVAGSAMPPDQQGSYAPVSAVGSGPATASDLPTFINDPSGIPEPTTYPGAAMCPDGNGTDVSFGVGSTEGFAGTPTIEQAAAKYPPKDAAWNIAKRDDTEALVVHGSHYLHLIKLPNGNWVVDSGGNCGSGDATIEH